MPANITTEIRGRSVNHTNLKNLRTETGLTQEELARLAGIGQGHLSRLEIGAQNDTASRILRRLADVIADTLSREVGSVLKDLTDPA